MTIKTTIFTHVSPFRFMFCWWRHNRLLMTSQWLDNFYENKWKVISNSLDIDFIHSDIHSRSSKKFLLLMSSSTWEIHIKMAWPVSCILYAGILSKINWFMAVTQHHPLTSEICEGEYLSQCHPQCHMQIGVILLNWKSYSFCLNYNIHMMTPSNGNIFHVTGHLCREFTSHRWIPLTKGSDAELWCFLWSAPE